MEQTIEEFNAAKAVKQIVREAVDDHGFADTSKLPLNARLKIYGIKQRKIAEAMNFSDGYLSRVISGSAEGPAADSLREWLDDLLDRAERSGIYEAYDDDMVQLAIDDAKLDTYEGVGDLDDF